MAGDLVFSIVESNVDVDSAFYKANKEAWSPLLSKFQQALKDISNKGSTASLSRHQERDQLLGQDLNSTG